MKFSLRKIDSMDLCQKLSCSFVVSVFVCLVEAVGADTHPRKRALNDFYPRDISSPWNDFSRTIVSLCALRFIMRSHYPAIRQPATLTVVEKGGVYQCLGDFTRAAPWKRKPNSYHVREPFGTRKADFLLLSDEYNFYNFNYSYC